MPILGQYRTMQLFAFNQVVARYPSLSGVCPEFIEARCDKKCVRYVLGWSQTSSCRIRRIRSNPRTSAPDSSVEQCKRSIIRCKTGLMFYISFDLVKSVSAALILPGRIPLDDFWIHPASNSVLFCGDEHAFNNASHALLTAFCGVLSGDEHVSCAHFDRQDISDAVVNDGLDVLSSG